MLFAHCAVVTTWSKVSSISKPQERNIDIYEYIKCVYIYMCVCHISLHRPLRKLIYMYLAIITLIKLTKGSLEVKDLTI